MQDNNAKVIFYSKILNVWRSTVLCELSPDFASYPFDKRIIMLKMRMEYYCKNTDRMKPKYTEEDVS